MHESPPPAPMTRSSCKFLTKTARKERLTYRRRQPKYLQVERAKTARFRGSDGSWNATVATSQLDLIPAIDAADNSTTTFGARIPTRGVPMQFTSRGSA